MALRLFNSRTRRVEPFTTRDPGHARIYVCGLTPSAQAHLGHARSFLFFDVLRRYLTLTGYTVTYVQNVTDIDDRSIAAAVKNGAGTATWQDVAGIVEGYYAAFTASMRKLGVEPPDHEPRATAYMREIIAMITGLVERGHAYIAEDAVYFRVDTFERYGRLAGRNIEELLVGARVAAGEHKRDPLDFALWKFARPGEPAWDSPWGPGRPGWHIECTAMSMSAFDRYQVHSGGEDLKFPHHANECAQARACVGEWNCPFMHCGHLSIEGHKMSKSLKNFVTIRDVLRTHSARQLRLLMVMCPWDCQMKYNEAIFEEAQAQEKRIVDFYAAIDAALRTSTPMKWGDAESELRSGLTETSACVDRCLRNNFNTREATTNLMYLIVNVHWYLQHTATPDTGILFEVRRYISRILGVFGLDFECRDDAGASDEILDEVCAFRSTVRGAALPLLKACDDVRKKLIGLGVRMEDSPTGPTVWKRVPFDQ